MSSISDQGRDDKTGVPWNAVSQQLRYALFTASALSVSAGRHVVEPADLLGAILLLSGACSRAAGERSSMMVAIRLAVEKLYSISRSDLIARVIARTNEQQSQVSTSCLSALSRALDMFYLDTSKSVIDELYVAIAILESDDVDAHKLLATAGVAASALSSVLGGARDIIRETHRY